MSHRAALAAREAVDAPENEVIMYQVPTIAPEDEVLSLTQLARELGVARNTAWVYCLRGWIPAREFPVGIIVRRADAEAFKATGEHIQQ